MKKISFVVAMMLACVVAFTSCKQPSASDSDLTKDDLNDTEWMIGTWKVTTKVSGSYDTKGYSDEEKQVVEKMFDEMLADEEKVETVEITKENVDEYKAKLSEALDEIADPENKKPYEYTEGNITYSESQSMELRISESKDVITIIMNEEMGQKEGEKEAKISISETKTWEKQ